MRSNSFDSYKNKECNTIKEFESILPHVKVNRIEEDKFSTYDFIFTSASTIFLTEVKTRNHSSGRYKDTVLEFDKVGRIFNEVINKDRIVKESKNHSSNRVIGGFLVKFTDGMYLFDLSKASSTISYKNCPATTAEDNGRKDKILLHYKLEEAIKLS